jgi:cellulose synthase/poly-beta-1,6-N-acetylglucosamine synthase-like glycosyltransferase
MPGTLDALARLEYPVEKLAIVFVDDGSADGTGELIQAWCADRTHAKLLKLDGRHGKYAALNVAIRSEPTTELIAVCDADLRPRPNWLDRLVPAFSDPDVAAAAAFISQSNADAGPVARYAAVESWVHQLVTSAGKDALGLNPPTLGASLYRRVALLEVGSFGVGVSGEDVRVSTRLTEAGWRIRFVESAVVDNAVVQSWRDYWHQHLRWARNVFASRTAGIQVVARNDRSLAQRAESRLAAAGYADRAAFLVVAIAAASRRLPRQPPARVRRRRGGPR